MRRDLRVQIPGTGFGFGFGIGFGFGFLLRVFDLKNSIYIYM